MKLSAALGVGSMSFCSNSAARVGIKTGSDRAVVRQKRACGQQNSTAVSLGASDRQGTWCTRQLGRLGLLFCDLDQSATNLILQASCPGLQVSYLPSVVVSEVLEQAHNTSGLARSLSRRDSAPLSHWRSSSQSAMCAAFDEMCPVHHMSAFR